MISCQIRDLDCLSTIMVFLEFLVASAMTFRVVMNYVSVLLYICVQDMDGQLMSLGIQ